MLHTSTPPLSCAPQSDLKNDLVPRFSNSPLGEELSRLHVGAMLSHSVGYDVLGSCELSSLERDALLRASE